MIASTLHIISTGNDLQGTQHKCSVRFKRGQGVQLPEAERFFNFKALKLTMNTWINNANL